MNLRCFFPVSGPRANQSSGSSSTTQNDLIGLFSNVWQAAVCKIIIYVWVVELLEKLILWLIRNQRVKTEFSNLPWTLRWVHLQLGHQEMTPDDPLNLIIAKVIFWYCFFFLKVWQCSFPSLGSINLSIYLVTSVTKTDYCNWLKTDYCNWLQQQQFTVTVTVTDYSNSLRLL